MMMASLTIAQLVRKNAELESQNAELREEVLRLIDAARATAEANAKMCKISPRDIAEHFCREAARCEWDVDHWTRVLEGYIAAERKASK